MKKVLLTTTALVMTAGVASAEVSFSGKGEAGVYRTAPTAAVTGAAGRDVTFKGNTGGVNGLIQLLDIDADGSWDNPEAVADISGTTASSANANGADIIEFLNGTLTVVPATVNTAAANAVTADELAEAQGIAARAAATVVTLQAAYDQAQTDATRKTALDNLNAGKARQAVADKALEILTGTAAAGKGATPKLKAYSGYDFNVALSGASDNGMTFSMGFDMGAGHIADQDDDRAMDAQGGAIANDELTITYAGYTVGIGDDLIDDLYDDSQNGDVSIAGSLGDLTFKLVTDLDDDVKAVAASKVYTAPSAANAGDSTFVDTAAVAAVYNPTSYSIGYTMGNIAFSMAGTEHDDRGHAAAKMSLAYTVSDATTVTLESDNVGTYKDIAKVSLKQKLSDAITITASIKDDKDHALNTNKNKAQSSDISVAYSAGALGATLATDEGSNWWVNAQYDLGGGAQAFTTFDHTEFLVAGVNFKF